MQPGTLAAPYQQADWPLQVLPGRVTVWLSRLPSGSPALPLEGLGMKVQGCGRIYHLTVPVDLERVRTSQDEVLRFWRDVFCSDLFEGLSVQQLRGVVTVVGSMLYFGTAGSAADQRALWDEFKTLTTIAADDAAALQPEDRTDRLLVPLFIWARLRNSFTTPVSTRAAPDEERSRKHIRLLIAREPGVQRRDLSNSTMSREPNQKPTLQPSEGLQSDVATSDYPICPEAPEANTARIHARFALASRRREDVILGAMHIHAGSFGQRVLAQILDSQIFLWDVAELLVCSSHLEPVGMGFGGNSV
ncbi:hypothetical protein C8T65DRAFT_698305 [Cerioporus squamosus]|nr:hypothetical protein C8T65DRAFT_698305 [Cerioporus squamosus]